MSFVGSGDFEYRTRDGIDHPVSVRLPSGTIVGIGKSWVNVAEDLRNLPTLEFRAVGNGGVEERNVEISGIGLAEPQRARDDDGHFVADDLSTEDVNEAWEGGESPEVSVSMSNTKSELIAAAKDLGISVVSLKTKRAILKKIQSHL